MTWLTESLGEFYSRAAVAASVAGKKSTQDLGSYAAKKTSQATPRSGPGTRTDGRSSGTLKASIIQSLVVHARNMHFTGVETNDPIALHVEYGTGLWGPKHATYPIIPVRARSLRFAVATSMNIKTRRVNKTRVIFTNLVNHPGSPGQHMFLLGITATELAHDRITEKNMRIVSAAMRSTVKK